MTATTEATDDGVGLQGGRGPAGPAGPDAAALAAGPVPTDFTDSVAVLAVDLQRRRRLTRAAVSGLVALVAAVALSLVAVVTTRHLPFGVRVAVGVLVLLAAEPAAVYPPARSAARALGGWGAATGLVRPRWRDLPQALGWMLALKVVIGVVLAVLIAAGLHQAGAGNTAGLRHANAATIALALPSAVLVAPVFEELLFRGLLLRALTARYGFTPALLVSSALFGAGHVRSLDSQGIGLFAGTALFGAALALLARRRGTLTLGIAVHALSNLASITLVLTLR